ncbi:MAG: hypothetical protein ACKVT1_16505 [Dehalococcoidia bacterium]
MEAVKISVSEPYLGKMPEVVVRLKEAGLAVEAEAAILGIITGLVDADGVDALRHVPGVEAVERQIAIQLPPADAPVQ